MYTTSFAVMLVATTTLLARPATADVQYNTTTYVGCYSSAGGMSKSDSFTYQSYGHCQEMCIPKSGQNPHAVMGLNQGSDCWCGSALPPESDKVDDGKCDKGCTGFGTDKCGGSDVYSVYLTGYDDTVAPMAGSDSGSSGGSDRPPSSSDVSNPPPSSAAVDTGSTTVSQPPSVITKAGETIVVTASGQADATSQPSSGGGGSNKVSIAIGVVVGAVVLCALVGGGIFFIRHRKRKAVEEEYRRNQAANSFVASDKPRSKGGSISDQRLDPSIHHRRQSDGSIADEMDFSRRILQVRNPDGV